MTELSEKQEAAIQQMANLMVQMTTMVGTRAQDFLTITNGGAAIACLGLMGSSSPYANASVVRFLLAIFLLGLVLAGVTMIRGFRYATKLAWAFGDTVARLRAGEAQWADLMRLFDPKAGKALFKWNVRIGAASLILFIAGGVAACAWLIAASNVSAPTPAAATPSLTQAYSLKAPAKGSVDISDLPYPAPRCKNGAKTCNPWEREWPPGATLPAGAIVDADGTVWPKGKHPSSGSQ